MTLGRNWERQDLGGGRFWHTQHIKPISYHHNGAFHRIVNSWEDSGIPGRPHIVTKAPFIISAGHHAMRRIHPTRELDRYFEIGAPFVKIGGVWQQVNLGTPTRTGNLLQWTKPQANMYVQMAGHYIKLAILLKGGWVPEDNLIAFPVGLQGLTRSGTQILADGRPVMHMRPAHVEDLDDPDDQRPVAHEFVKVGGQWHVLLTLPDLAGMSRPLIDPTFSAQPDAAAGLDTDIYQESPTNNYGNGLYLRIGESANEVRLFRALIKFDLSTLPDSAVISSATFSLWCYGHASDNARTMRVYRQKRAWVEGEATWNLYSTGNNWQTSGGFGSDDCEQSDIGSREFSATEALDEFKDFALTSVTKAALDFGNGWLIKTDTENADKYSFRSSDYATPGERPKLGLEYTVGTPARLYQYRRRRT